MRDPPPSLLATLLVALVVLAGCDAGGPPDQSGEPATRPSGPAEEPPRDIEFIDGYLRGYQQARQAGKPMLVLFAARGCGYCERMMSDASTDEQVVALSRRFVCILVDADAEPDVCRDFRVQGYPTIQFISPRGVPLNRLMGQTPSRRLALQMQAALEATASRLWHDREATLR
jgi:protein disulfide-isomerase